MDVDQGQLNAYRDALTRRSTAKTGLDHRQAKQELQRLWRMASPATKLAMDMLMHEFDSVSVTPAKPWNPYEAADPHWPHPHRE